MKFVKAIILAAGKTGTDALDEPYGEFPNNYKPKCLFKVDGTPLLDTNVTLLRQHGIAEIIIVIGYQKEKVIAHAQKRGLDLIFVDNPLSDADGATDSLLLGLEKIGNDETVVVVLGDVVLSHGILRKLLACESELIFCRNQDNLIELYLAKFVKRRLGDLEAMKAWILELAPEYRGKFLGFCQYLEQLGAEDVWADKGELDDIDGWNQVAKWEEEDDA